MAHYPDVSQQPDTSARRLAGFLSLFLLLSGLGTWAIYDRFAGRDVRFDERLLAPETLLAALGLLLVYFLADGLRLHFTLRALGHHLAFRPIFRLVFINIFFSNVTPLATGGGFAQIWYLHKRGVPIGTATAATTIRTILAILFIFSVTPVCLLWLDALQGRPVVDRLSGLLALLILLYLAFFLVVLFRTRWLSPLLTAVVNGLHRLHLISDARAHRWQFKLRRELLRFARSFSTYLRGDWRFVLLSIALTLVFLISLFSFPALLMWALGYSVDYVTVLGLLFVTTFIMYFAPTPGASGISEGVFGSFFSPLLGSTHLVLVTVAWRFLTIYLGMLIGLIVTQFEVTRRGRS
ncbi:hypothetical protein C8D92_10651 [Tamilnaduibacter salinus]|uniref:TIGR00374 family protein n=1 Tax=Tamilnaduibacter salinus TaxID=1484056 RepID=A0A2U1CVR9_9GAMM|nr:lysylphosphatidylglycerol synthase transmembrane domain-containing protein [Tamilnaduibacter salinus]PVY75791.1 hypothetical protein C8D92_10651 [Tamilnaduibacter salinus]